VICTLVKESISSEWKTVIRELPSPKGLDRSWRRTEWEIWAKSIGIGERNSTNDKWVSFEGKYFNGFEESDLNGWVQVREVYFDHAIRARVERAAIHHHEYLRLVWETKVS
jgi:hypothetical protein